LGHLSGIATLTREFVNKARPYKAKILDTRKTVPGMRMLEKYAVRCGGGINHRMGLWDEVLIKENHIAAISYQLSAISRKRITLEKIIRDIRKKMSKDVQIEIEVRSLNKLKDVIKGRPDIILLDNMNIHQIRKAVRIRDLFLTAYSLQLTAILLEVSGRVNLTNVRQFAKAGVDRISIGALTHSAKPLDLSLQVWW
jgi:nicotinate-nucleotide pyrophosphorylase (carboxylating)